jgi:hypothetical protein
MRRSQLGSLLPPPPDFDVTELLDKAEHVDIEELGTLEDIANQVYNTLTDHGILEAEKIQDMTQRLINYRLVDEVHQLKKGRHVRWLRRGSQTLTSGAIVMDIAFMSEGVTVLLKNKQNRFMRYKWDDCTTFQQLSEEEQFLLSCLSYIK